jgi:ADP-ribose pyrophosphatase YjhB (NUDIX family)
MNLFIKLLYQASKFILILLKPLTNGVRLLLVREDQILLVKHMYEDKWYLPGGLVERGETLDEAVRREAMEEVGASLNDLQLFGAYSNFREHRNDHVIVFISHDFSLNGISDHEIEKTAFFSFDYLPENVSEGSSNRIKEYVSNERIRFGNW